MAGEPDRRRQEAAHLPHPAPFSRAVNVLYVHATQRILNQLLSTDSMKYGWLIDATKPSHNAPSSHMEQIKDQISLSSSSEKPNLASFDISPVHNPSASQEWERLTGNLVENLNHSSKGTRGSTL